MTTVNADCENKNDDYDDDNDDNEVKYIKVKKKKKKAEKVQNRIIDYINNWSWKKNYFKSKSSK